MVIAHLTRHWYARRHFPLPSWAACVARSLRVLLFYRFHLRLLALEIYRNYVSPAHDDVFHHLSHRHYLIRGLSLQQRVHCVGVHYRFEQATFDCTYKRAVYSGGGLVVWQRELDGAVFSLRLEMAARLCAEGDLTICAYVGDQVVHRLSFSWVEGTFVGVDAPIVPFVARNQGRRADVVDAFAAFERAFPQNSPSFFCFAALQGIALALGIDQAVAVKSTWQCSYTAVDDRHFANAYDGFWQTLGGMPLSLKAYRIALPFYSRPLSDTPAKHRKRARMRREHWAAISDSAYAALGRRLVATVAPAPMRRSGRPDRDT